MSSAAIVIGALRVKVYIVEPELTIDVDKYNRDYMEQSEVSSIIFIHKCFELTYCFHNCDSNGLLCFYIIPFQQNSVIMGHNTFLLSLFFM